MRYFRCGFSRSGQVRRIWITFTVATSVLWFRSSNHIYISFDEMQTILSFLWGFWSHYEFSARLALDHTFPSITWFDDVIKLKCSGFWPVWLTFGSHQKFWIFVRYFAFLHSSSGVFKFIKWFFVIFGKSEFLAEFLLNFFAKNNFLLNF